MKGFNCTLAGSLLIGLTMTLGVTTTGYSQAPKTLTYQGRLSDGGGPLNGTYNISFTIYDAASGGNALWTELATNVSVTAGNLVIILGKTTPINVQTDKPLWLGITVGANPEVTPRVELTASLYALGLAFPVSGFSAAPGNMLTLTSSAPSGNAGRFVMNNPGGDRAVTIESNSNSQYMDALQSIMTGTGGAAGSFIANNANHESMALYAETDGKGNSIFSYSGSNSQSPGIYTRTDGTGAAGSFNVTNVNSAAPGLIGWTNGTGSAGEFTISNAASSAPAINILNYGTGNAITANAPVQATKFIGDGSLLTNLPSSGLSLPFSSNVNVASSAFSVGNSNGNYGAALFFSNSMASATLETQSTANSALNAVHNGANGIAGIFDVQIDTNPGNAIWARTLGTGQVALFRTQNNSNYSSTILTEQQGLGSAGQFDITNNVNNAAAIQINHAGTGNAITANRPIQATQFIGDGSLLTNLPGGFTLPYSGFSSNANTLLNVTNTYNAGPGGAAANFGSSATGTATLNTTSDGWGALYAGNFGYGVAGQFIINNVSNASVALQSAVVNGSGSAASFDIQNASNSAAAVVINHAGTGNAITANRPIQATQFIGDGSLLTNLPPGTLTLPFGASSAAATNLFDLTHTGQFGAVGRFVSTNVASQAPSLYVQHSGVGVAGSFYSSNSSNPSAALNVVGLGTGGGINVSTNNPNAFAVDAYVASGANGSVLRAWQQSANGYAAYFQTSNSSNSYPTILISQSSSGQGLISNATTGVSGQFFNNGTSPTVLASHSGTSNALQVNHIGPSGNIATFLSSTVQARIDKTGKGFFNGGTQTGGADVAEMFDVEGETSQYEPGDVLIISENSDRAVEKSFEPNSTKIAGVYATKPGVILTERGIEDKLDDLVPMGVVGVIPTKVCDENGSIKRGDLLVTSSMKGRAMKAIPVEVNGIKIYPTGAILGKALENFSAGTGMIEVLVNVK